MHALSPRPAFLAACAALAFALATPGRAAAALDVALRAAPGAWELALDDTNRKCRLTIREEEKAHGRALAMPAGCRRALPILSDVVAWAPTESGALRMVEADGRDALTFVARADGALVAKGPEGETYTFEALDPQARQQFAQAQPAPVPGFQPARPAAPKPAPAESARPGELAGRYAILREGGKDTGCMLTLDERSRGPKGTLKALLAPACRDNGMVIFDPQGWTMEKGRLSLLARKGHTAKFDRQPDGIWLKDPKDGKPLSLRRI